MTVLQGRVIVSHKKEMPNILKLFGNQSGQKIAQTTLVELCCCDESVLLEWCEARFIVDSTAHLEKLQMKMEPEV
jgi:hypothetical protein